MERISANGETYVKASSIARELGYTADYVGQLCRGGHVDAQLVGRSWYVNEESIRAHKRNRYRSSAAKSKAAIREHVEARTVRTPMNAQVHSRTAPPSAFRYETDDEALLPNMQQKPTPAPEPRPEPVSEAQESEGSVITLRKVEEVHEEPVMTEPEESKETERLSVEPHSVPLRRGSALTVRARKMREEAIQRLQAHPVSISRSPQTLEIQEPLPVPTSGGQWALVGVSFVTAAAIVTSVALIGFESRSIADSTGSYTAYELNFASAIAAMK